MSVLTITDVPDETVAELERRAAAHGVSVEDEARRVLEEQTARSNAESFKAHLLAMPDVGEDWMFDRNDPRMKRPERPPIDLED
jgi:plasmid stability protein